MITKQNNNRKGHILFIPLTKMIPASAENIHKLRKVSLVSSFISFSLELDVLHKNDIFSGNLICHFFFYCIFCGFYEAKY